MKLFLRSVSLAVVATGMVASASSCSSSTSGFGSGDDAGSPFVILPDGGLGLVTDGGVIPIVVTEAGVMVAPGSDASLPTGFEAGTLPPPGLDASLPPGVDATIPPGSDATVPPGVDATIPPGSDATVPPGVDAAPPGVDAAPGTEAGCDAAAPVACSPSSTGGIKLSSNYLPASDGIGMGGYAYSYSDTSAGGTSTSCIAPTQLCAKGSIDMDNYPTTPDHFGAGIGFNLNQAQATGCTSTPVDPYTIPSGSLGISYKLSSLPTGGARLVIGNAVTTGTTTTGTDYCVAIGAMSGTIPWTQFNSECWSGAGTFLTGPPSGPIHINIGLPSSATKTSTFDFCVESMAFATTIPDAGTGPATTCSGGTACCKPSSGPSANGDGSFTCYTFKQGTPGNKTYCGYAGSETTYSGGSGGACESQNNTGYTDTVPNVGPPSDYFAAFPGPGGPFGNGTLCGMCVNVTYGGKTLMATVADECPSGSNPLCGVNPPSNHLDLSASLARDLGFGTGTIAGNPSNVTWAAVACPISSNGGHIVEVFNGTSTQVYFQNLVWPVKSVSVNGTAATQPDGYWMLPSGSGSISMTDTYGHTITGTLPGTNGGSLGIQFPATCN